jgi:hypothetical protein
MFTMQSNYYRISLHKVPTALCGHLINTNNAFASALNRLPSDCAGSSTPLSLNSSKAGCRLKDWTQRMFELDFKTCELRYLSRQYGGSSHSAGFIQKDTEIKAGIWLTITDSSTKNNDATLWTFEVTFFDAAGTVDGGRTIIFGCPQKDERDRWVAAIESMIQEKLILDRRWQSFMQSKQERLAKEYSKLHSSSGSLQGPLSQEPSFQLSQRRNGGRGGGGGGGVGGKGGGGGGGALKDVTHKRLVADGAETSTQIRGDTSQNTSQKRGNSSRNRSWLPVVSGGSSSEPEWREKGVGEGESGGEGEGGGGSPSKHVSFRVGTDGDAREGGEERGADKKGRGGGISVRVLDSQCDGSVSSVLTAQGGGGEGGEEGGGCETGWGGGERAITPWYQQESSGDVWRIGEWVGDGGGGEAMDWVVRVCMCSVCVEYGCMYARMCVCACVRGCGCMYGCMQARIYRCIWAYLLAHIHMGVYILYGCIYIYGCMYWCMLLQALCARIDRIMLLICMRIWLSGWYHPS